MLPLSEFIFTEFVPIPEVYFTPVRISFTRLKIQKKMKSSYFLQSLGTGFVILGDRFRFREQKLNG